MPNVSRKRLLQSIRKEKNTVARDRMLACLHRKEGWSIRRICTNHGPALLHHARWLWPCRKVVSAAGTTRTGDENVRYPRRYSGQSGAWVKKEPSDFQIRVGLVAAEPVARDDQGAFRAGMQRARFAGGCAETGSRGSKSRHVPYKTASKSVRISSSKRQEGLPDATRKGVRRVYRRRGCTLQNSCSVIYG